MMKVILGSDDDESDTSSDYDESDTSSDDDDDEY